MKKYIKYLSVIIVLIVASLPLSAQDKVIKKLVDGENQRIVIYEMCIRDRYGGTEAGNAIADVLFGEVNPSGKLPFSFPVKIEDNAAHAFNAYPGDGETVEYKEGIFVGRCV